MLRRPLADLQNVLRAYRLLEYRRPLAALPSAGVMMKHEPDYAAMTGVALTDAFRNADQQRSYREPIMVTKFAHAHTAAGWSGNLTSRRLLSAEATISKAASIGSSRLA